MFAALNAFQTGGGGSRIIDVFSTTLYTGNGSSQTITNDIDLSTNGGLVWCKNRDSASNHWLSDTERGINQYLQTQNTDASSTLANSLTAFNSNGFSIGSNGPNDSTKNYVSWTFRQQSRFFDVVKFTTNGTPSPTISHNLGSEPGLIILKRLDSASGWVIYHRSIGKDGFLRIDTTDAVTLSANYWGSSEPTSTSFTSPFFSTGDYVAYLFAHNAGGFGGYGADNAVSCGSYTGGSGTVSVNLGYEPQLILKKKSSGNGNWIICDNVRGMASGTTTKSLVPNLTNAETSNFLTDGYIYATSTGFSDDNSASGETYIYVAIKAS